MAICNHGEFILQLAQFYYAINTRQLYYIGNIDSYLLIGHSLRILTVSPFHDEKTKPLKKASKKMDKIVQLEKPKKKRKKKMSQ